MNSSNKAVTSCEGCVFGRDKNDVQTGCDLERAEKLGIRETEENGSYLLDRYCTAYRPEEWYKELTFDESMDPKNTVREELIPRIGFFVNLDTSHEDAIGQLNKTLASIAQNNNPAYVAVVTDKVEYNVEIWECLVGHFGETGPTKFHVVQLNQDFPILDRIVDEAFTHAQNGWIYIAKSGHEVPEVTKALDKIINDDLVQLMLITPYEEIYGMAFQAMLFKFLNGNRTKVFNDGTSLSGLFIDKVKQSQERTEAKCVYSWEEVFDAS